jgi:hypothetical protein
MASDENTCPVCSEAVLAPPSEQSHVTYLRAETGAIIIADGEYPLHRCDSLTREDERDLLRDAGLLFGGELDNP